MSHGSQRRNFLKGCGLLACFLICGDLQANDNPCRKLYAKIDSNANSPKPIYVDDKVSILYSPSKIHTGLSVDGVVYNPLAGFRQEEHALEVFERAAKRSDIGGTYKISLRVTEEELAQLKGYLEQNVGKGAFQTCVSGTCKALKQNTSILIPLPFSKSPALNLAYFKLAKVLGYERVVSVEYIGVRSWTGSILEVGSYPAEFGFGAMVYSPLIVGGTVAFMAIRAVFVDKTGKKKEVVVVQEVHSVPN